MGWGSCHSAGFAPGLFPPRRRSPAPRLFFLVRKGHVSLDCSALVLERGVALGCARPSWRRRGSLIPATSQWAWGRLSTRAVGTQLSLQWVAGSGRHSDLWRGAEPGQRRVSSRRDGAPHASCFAPLGRSWSYSYRKVASCVAWVVTVFGVPPSPAVCPRLGQRVPPKCTGGPWALLAPWVPSRRPLRGPELPSQAAVTSRRPGSHDASWWRESPAMRAGERGWGLGPGGGPGRALRF